MSRSSLWSHGRSAVLVGGVLLALASPGTALSATESVAVFAAPLSGEASLEASVTSVSPSGESFTVGTTAFSFPDIPMGVRDRLQPGAFARVRFATEGGENVVTAIELQGTGRGSRPVVWSRAPGTIMPRFGLGAGRTAGGS